LSQVGRIETPGGGGEDNRASLAQRMLCYSAPGEFVVFAVGDYELRFIGGAKLLDVGPQYPVGLATGGALEIDYADGPLVDLRYVQRTVGLQKRFESGVAEGLQASGGLLLVKRFATGEFHQSTTEPPDICEDIVDGHFVALGAGMDRVAPGAIEITAGQAHQHARRSCAGSLTLDAQDNLVDNEAGILQCMVPQLVFSPMEQAQEQGFSA